MKQSKIFVNMTNSTNTDVHTQLTCIQNSVLEDHKGKPSQGRRKKKYKDIECVKILGGQISKPYRVSHVQEEEKEMHGR